MKDIKKEVANTIKADVFEMVMKSLQGIEKRQSFDLDSKEQEYQELIGQGKTYEQAMEILTELYGSKDGEADDENNIYE